MKVRPPTSLLKIAHSQPSDSPIPAGQWGAGVAIACGSSAFPLPCTQSCPLRPIFASLRENQIFNTCSCQDAKTPRRLQPLTASGWFGGGTGMANTFPLKGTVLQPAQPQPAARPNLTFAFFAPRLAPPHGLGVPRRCRLKGRVQPLARSSPSSSLKPVRKRSVTVFTIQPRCKPDATPMQTRSASGLHRVCIGSATGLAAGDQHLIIRPRDLELLPARSRR